MQLEGIRAGWSGLRPLERIAALVWILILVVVCIRVAVSPRTHSVFPIFSTAGLHWRHGQELYAPYFSDSDLDVFRYSPLAAASFVPWTYFSDRVGNVFWRLASAALYLSALAWWSRTILSICLTRSQQALLFLFAVPLSVGCMNNGQSNVLLVALLLASTAGIQTGRWNLAAGCMAFAVLLKIYPMALGLLFSFFFPRKFGTRFFLALTLGIALPFVLQNPFYVAGQYAHWWELLLADQRHERALSNACSRDLWLLIRLGQIPMTLLGYRATQLVIAGGICALCLAGRGVGWSQRHLLTLIFGLGSCWMVLCGPATESCTYILLAPILAGGLLESLIDGQRPIWSRIIPWFGFSLFVLSQITSWFPEEIRMRVLGMLPLAGVVLFVSLVEAGIRGIIQNSSGSSIRSRFELARTA
jgi:hypothetical protein